MPDLTFELRHAVRGPVAGVDEAGRGPLAGPVVAAAVILDPACIPDGIDDSKALTATKRAALCEAILRCARVGIGIASVEEIDRINVLHAAMIAMRRAVRDLRVVPDRALIDGNRLPPGLPCPAEALVKGDARIAAIGAASIIAKTVRDRLMQDASARFPGYGFDGHKGYPCPAHKTYLSDQGPCAIHRRSYAPVRAAYRQPAPGG